MEKQTILIVDDAPDNIDILSNSLRPEFRVKAALSGEKALKIARTSPPPDLVLLDIMMPGIDGYEVLKNLKSDPSTDFVPVIFVTAKSEDVDEEKGLTMGAVDYISKPINPAIVRARVKTQLALYNQNRELDRKVNDRTRQINETRLEIIRRLGRAAEYKDNETGLHVIRMSYYSRLIAESHSKNEEWVETLFNAAPMHDIGKIGIPDRILLKPGKLNADEWEIMKKHTNYGAEIIGDHNSELLKMAKIIAENHHEKWDGSGYPHGFAGEEIPIHARIIAIADVFDALTTERPYKKAWTVEKAVEEIEEQVGKHFDPNLVNLFRERLPEILDIKELYAEKQI